MVGAKYKGKKGKRLTKLTKIAWFGNPNIREINGKSYYGLLGKPNKTKKAAKASAERWRDFGSKARVFKVKGGYRVYVTKKRRR